MLPLVPGYLSAVTGVSASELEDANWRRVLGPSLLFVASFSAIFILLGLTATGLGSFLQDHKELLTKISGALIIAMGVLFVASLFVTRLNHEWHVDALLERAGKGGPIVAGAAFAIAWTPCIGPTLGAILSAASLSDSAARGALLLAVYSAGLAIPFLLTALAFSRMTTAFAVVKRHYQLIVADRRRDPDRDGRPDLDRRAHPAQHRSPELARRTRASTSGTRSERSRAAVSRHIGGNVACGSSRLSSGPGATVSSSLPTASVISRPLSSRSREQTMRKRPVPISPSGTTGRPRIVLPAQPLDLERVHPHLGRRERAVRVVLVDRLGDRLQVLRLGGSHGPV